MNGKQNFPQHFTGRRFWISGLVVALGLVLVLALFQVVPLFQTAPDENKATPGKPTKKMLLATGKKLYVNYCAQCHGDAGDGNGPAAKFLYPKPRNFREGLFRLVTTVNRLPSDEDLLYVLNRGMPGSAMFPFAHLAEIDRRALVAYVRLLTRQGLEAAVRKEAADAGETISKTKMNKVLDRLTRPGKALRVPAGLPPYSKESVARGQVVYLDRCSVCHGRTGRGDGATDRKDEEGFPIMPRDYVRGIFKGGREARQLYARIVVGMPGTPMLPFSDSLKPRQIGDLINFIHSLSDASAQAKVEHKRTNLLVHRVQQTLPSEISAAAWKAARAMRIVVSPLWWREYDEPDLHVAALHDGKTLAIRLTWRDRTRNDQAVRPQDFEDMAAVQLFKGRPEPFLGMGAADKPLDVWLWRAGWQRDRTDPADVDTQYPNMAVDWYPFEKAGKGPRPHAPAGQPVPFLTARAAGNPQANPARGYTGSNLRARGFGTLTMRPPISQVVRATGKWTDGRWTVVLRRPLAVKNEAGIPLAAGDKLSIAFALWDGGAGDRNGKKLVSIWHDLELE
jgi:mono/diheme cytochrome c family protein